MDTETAKYPFARSMNWFKSKGAFATSLSSTEVQSLPINPYGLWLVGFAPLLAQLIGSAFNIWYNLSRIQPLLTSAQHQVFGQTILLYNGLVYPIAIALWSGLVYSLHAPLQAIVQQHPLKPDKLAQARRRVINLPWLGTSIAGISWLLCIPVFLGALHAAPGVLDVRVFFYLPVSLIISALIAVTHSFFAIELLSQSQLYPWLFQGINPSATTGAFALSLRHRGLLLALSAGVCPIVSLLLLSLIPYPGESQTMGFAMAVGGLGILFGLISAWMVGRLVVEPVEALQNAARAVSAGDLTAQVTLLRADEFGMLIDEFNLMVLELQEKQRLQETFGQHVGQKAAQQILQRDPSLGGVEQELTVMFVDIRNFTARCATAAPQHIVALLNLFFTEMVEIIEQEQGMVNKFLGDGFMALFGVGDDSPNHAVRAVAAAQEMLRRLPTINQRCLQTGHDSGQAPLSIGIGIHTGTAIVGSIGAPQRLEYTAIGDTINIAARVESLTKLLAEPLLITQATRQHLPPEVDARQLPPQWVKGQPQPLAVYGVSRR
jgi:adenylate cyclase